MIKITYCQACKWVFSDIDPAITANECGNGHKGQLNYISGDETKEVAQFVDAINKVGIAEEVVTLTDPRLNLIKSAMAKDPDEVVVRCIICSESYTNKQIDNLRACLKCSTRAMPMPVNGDLENVKVNWLELMILVEWAEQWAHVIHQNTKDKVSVDIIGAIAKRLSVYRKPGTQALLPMERMMEQRRTDGYAPRIIVPPPVVGGRIKLN